MKIESYDKYNTRLFSIFFTQRREKLLEANIGVLLGFLFFFMYSKDVLRKVLNTKYKNKLTVPKFRKATPSFVMSLRPFDCTLLLPHTKT